MVMSERSKGRSWSMPDAAELVMVLYDLQSMLDSEEKFKSEVSAVCVEHDPDEVSYEARNDAAHSIRCLVVWFDLPDSVFFVGINLMDRFLSKMKVKKKFLACLSVSCLYLSSVIHKMDVNVPNLINISQSKCSERDLLRMSNIVREKLNVQVRLRPVTVLDYLYAFLKVFECLAAAGIAHVLYFSALQKQLLVKRLQAVMTDSECAGYRPSMLALVLIHTNGEWHRRDIPNNIPHHSMELLQLFRVIFELQQLCGISAEDYFTCYKQVLHVLEDYDYHRKIRRGRKMEWRFSKCTLSAPKPSDSFVVRLSPVQEG